MPDFDKIPDVKGFFLRPKREKGNNVLWGASQFFPGVEWEHNGCLIVLSCNIDRFLESVRKHNLSKKLKVEYRIFPLPGMEDIES
jgi:hypothetical protein